MIRLTGIAGVTGVTGVTGVIGVIGVIGMLAVRVAGQAQQQDDGGCVCGVRHVRSCTRTSRIMPASMW